MKVLWIVLGVLFGLCLICGGFLYFGFNKVRGVSDDAGTFGDTSFKAIATTWNLQELESRAAPEIAEQNGKDALPNLVALLGEKLGPMKTFKSTLGGLEFKNNNGVTNTFAKWSATATFDKGDGTVEMQLIAREGKWEILKFDVQSPLLPGANNTSEEQTKNDEPNVPATTG